MLDNNFIDWEEKPELNITPLVDIMLVLLAILMVTTPAVIYKEEISLPQGSKSSKVSQDEKLEVRMDLDKKIYIKNDVYEYNTFPDSLNLLASRYDKNMSIYIRADKRLAYQDVIYLLKSIKEAGFHKVSLVTTN
ncbi:biopolymer transporter ExbD [Helicobacter anseris]|uniref:Biopolymer transporter ExbD n=1 Tax=Helicobacter anseris TaxID=375926 RepID=A0A3D8JC62_9HELI|nr:biopolymer transporter ExbD [Helicobacter anseris]RDU74666.1 biopolymer transporter ExbD [Helicobacter anseris]